MKKEILLSILGIIAGELMMFLGHVYISIAIHAINLEAITLNLMFRNSTLETKKVLESFILLLLIRMINLSMPQFFTMTLLSYPLVYGVMLLPIYSIMRIQSISLKEIGINFKRLYLYIPAALLIGSAMAFIEYRILHPVAMIEDLRFTNLVLIITVMFLFVGFVEELIFRSILLTRLEKVFGKGDGLLITSALFGIMHAGYAMINEILFAVVFGLVAGYIFQRTRSLPFILTINGTANVLLFGVLPIVLR